MIQNNTGTPIPADTTLTLDVVAIKYEAPDNDVGHGYDFENWLVDAGSSKDTLGVTVVQNGTSEFARIDVSGLSPNTTYWARIRISAQTASAGNLRVMAWGTDGSQIAGVGGVDLNITAGVGWHYFQLQTNGDAGPHRLAMRHAAGTDTHSITFDAFDIFAVQERSADKICILGDRTGSFISGDADAISDTVLGTNADALNVIQCGDSADTTNSYPTCNDRLTQPAAGPHIGDGIFDRGGLVYFIMGNHDYDGTRETEIHGYYGTAGLNGGEYYFHKDFTNIRFVSYDDNVENADNGGGFASSVAAQEASTMGLWMADLLQNSTKRWNLVGIHHPPYTSGSPGAFPNNRMQFANWGAHVVIAAHDHSLEHRLEDDGLYYIICAMGGCAHHGWAAIQPNTLWREEDTFLEGYIKVYDTENILIFEWRDVSDNVLWRSAVEQSEPLVRTTLSQSTTYGVGAFDVVPPDSDATLPVKPPDFFSLIVQPEDDLCTMMKKAFLQFPVKLYQWFKYWHMPDGTFTSNFKRDVCEACAALRGDTTDDEEET